MKENNFNIRTSLSYISHGETKNPKHLMIFLHGYGSNKENLITLAHHFTDCLPDSLFVSPDAPFSLANDFADNDFFDFGNKWFSIATNDGDKTFESSFKKSAPEIKESNQILSSFIDELLKKFNLQNRQLFLLGFSQGAMMSVYQGLTRKEEIAGVISYSGKVILPTFLGEYGQNILSKPHMSLFHGKKDNIVAFENFLQSKDVLKRFDIPFEAHEFENLEHQIIAEEIEITKKFILKRKS
jgi:phospholipase/carboxylesterase